MENDLASKHQSVLLNQKSKSIIETFDPETRKFYDFHGIQILGSEFPITLVPTLYQKLKKQLYDGGQYFQVMDNSEEQTFQLRAKQPIKKLSNVFIIDHTLTFRYPDLRKLLLQNTKVVPRILNILKYSTNYKELPWKEEVQKKKQQSQQNDPNQIQFDSMGLKQITHLQFPPNTVTLSLIDNELTNEQQLMKKLDYLNLKGLWINNNPIADSQAFLKYVKEKTKIEIYNSKLTEHCTLWGLKYCLNRSNKEALSIGSEKIYKLNLDGRNVYAIDVSLLNKFANLAQLSLKDHKIQTEQHRGCFKHILSLPKLRNIFVDFETELQLFKTFGGTEIGNKVMINYHSLKLNAPTQLDAQCDLIHNAIFRLGGCYRLANTEKLDQTSIWYLNDELGSAATHSDRPNIRIIPFLYSSDNKMGENVQAFSLMWPIEDLKKDTLCQRDYLNGLPQSKQRSSRLSIWYKIPKLFYNTTFHQFNNKMIQLNKAAPNILQQFYKVNHLNQKEQIAKLQESQQLYPDSHRLITNDELILSYLKDQKVQFVTELSQATIVWLSECIADEQQWKEYRGKFYINQFPFEACLVNKKSLADTVQSVFGDTPFLMRTYDLQSQLPHFLGDYYNREQRGDDNLWIIKPPNMARSMDMVITDCLPLIVKEMETGPKIVQKYISNPVLRNGKKVDLRFVVGLKCMMPLTMFLYKHFWIRSSNNGYTTDCRSLATYQTQFTVMNYGQKSQFQQIPYTDFITDFQKDYKMQWKIIDEKIKKMLRIVFIACAKKYPEMHYNKSRAVYGVDIMIDADTMEPKLLELTFAPDCKRACKYYPTFYDDIFNTLFFDLPSQNMERVI